MRNKRNLLLLIIVIIPVLFIFINRTFSLSYTEEIKSVEIESNDYNNPGSWHIDKSAEWTGFGKVRVTFDVNSVIKTVDGRYKDVILVMDISGSMYGDKLDRAKEDAIDLTNYLLSDSNNKVALITFNSNSTLVSGFTNNKSQMVDYINNISAIGTTNYNSGLLNVDNVMEDYVRDENTDLITLFLTDGYPNEDTPNQVATYQVLKDKYPYMTINGIQYEMGQDIIQEIIDISDNQFIANINTLNNILFEATISSIKYENFVIEDYIYGDYFYVDSANDIEVPFGTVTVENVNGTQKITWN
ncbi:MAG: VWA domain-containing protein, partial [Bacilli bacterium]|nr:VWA domain-containing protein [Bacilli bacterium]